MSDVIDATGLAIWRYEVPIDDQWHDFNLIADPLHVALVDGGPSVEFWTYGRPQVADRVVRRFRAFGTGRALPPHKVRHWGTVIGQYPGGRGVWHLVEEWAGGVS